MLDVMAKIISIIKNKLHDDEKFCIYRIKAINTRVVVKANLDLVTKLSIKWSRIEIKKYSMSILY